MKSRRDSNGWIGNARYKATVYLTHRLNPGFGYWDSTAYGPLFAIARYTEATSLTEAVNSRNRAEVDCDDRIQVANVVGNQSSKIQKMHAEFEWTKNFRK